MHILFIQTQPSQLDAPFFSQLYARTGGKVSVAILNNLMERSDIDVELGFKPIFPKFDSQVFLNVFGCGIYGVIKLFLYVCRCRPELIVVQDQSWLEKFFICFFCKLLKINVAIRSDKNSISTGAKFGFSLLIERYIVRNLFDIYVPVSHLTTDYYGWKYDEVISLPYLTQEQKFYPTFNAKLIRHEIRNLLKIDKNATVFLAVTKFVERENPLALLKAFFILQKKPSKKTVELILIGAGELEPILKNYVLVNDVKNVHFLGYIPFDSLQKYYFSSDVFLHFAHSEPWGVSPQDALVSGLGLITSNKVGSGLCFLKDNLSKYLVDSSDEINAANLMYELIQRPHAIKNFLSAWTMARENFTVNPIVDNWINRFKLLD